MHELDHPIVIVVPGDLHLTDPELENATTANWVVEQANSLIHPDFVQFIGDNVQDATEGQFRLFNEIRGRLESPHFALVGDHDVKGDSAASRFRRHLGDTYGSTSLRGFRFIRLNTQESRPVGLSAEQTTWFAREVDAALAVGERVVVFQHNYPYQIWEDFAGPGIDKWREVVHTRRIESIVCGHTHYGQVANDGRNVVTATRSIGEPEGGPPGYTLLYFRGDEFAMTFRSIEDRGPVILVTSPREKLLCTGAKHIVSGHQRVIVRVWPEAAISTVRFRVDDQAWGELEPMSDGHWSAPLSGHRLYKGEHVLEVSASGTEIGDASQRVVFTVDPTGRYTPVPEVRPVVHSTKFC
jgi:hypothetical protein